MTDPIQIVGAAAAVRNAATPGKVTLSMLLCGLALRGVAGAADAAAPDRGVPTLTVHFNRPSLATEVGARSVYRRIVDAAQSVCPLQSGSPFATGAVKACREAAVSRAVHDIGSPRLVALHATSTNHG